MSWKRPIFAFVIFILMVLAFFLDSQIIWKKRISIVREASLADSVNLSDIDQIYLRNGQGSVKIIRTSTGWQMKEPVDAPADPEIVDTFLTNVTAARRRNMVEGKNLSQYGLGNPEIELSLVTDTAKFGDWGTSFGLELGYSSIYTGQVFARYPERDEVFTVGEHVKNTLLRSPLDFRRTRVLDVDVGNLDRYQSYRLDESHANLPEDFSAEGTDVSISSESHVELTNTPEGWKITQPFEGVAEQEIVDEYFNRLGLLRAIGFVTEASDRFTSLTAANAALSSPTLVATLQGVQPNDKQQLIIGLAEGTNGPVYVARRAEGTGEIMVLTTESVAEVRRNSHYFRTRSLFDLKPEEIGLFTVQVARATATSLIRNDKGLWELVADREFRINQATVNERLGSLLNMRIVRYVDANPADLSIYGLDVPRFRFVLTSKDDETKSEMLEIGKPVEEVGGLSYARSSRDKAIFTVQVSPDLLIIPSEIADKNFARVDYSRLLRVEMEIDEEKFQLMREGDEWKILKPGQNTPSTVDMRQAVGLLQMLSDLQYNEDVTGDTHIVVAPEEGPKLSLRFFGEDDVPLNEVNVVSRINNKTTVVNNGRGRTFEVDSQMINRIYSLIKGLTR